jgi:Spy/CpxP family protein refolding chaperone
MNTLLRFLSVAGLVALAGVAVAPILAQDGPPPQARRMGPGGPGFGPGPGGPMGLLGELGRGLRELDLSDVQREQIRGIVESHQAAFRDIGDRMRAAHEGMETLIGADAVDEAAIRAKSAELAAVQADAAVLRARVHHDVFGVLTAEQQARAKELRAQRQARMKERGQAPRERRPRAPGQR